MNMITIFPQILATQTAVEPWISSAGDLFQPHVSSEEGKGEVATRRFISPLFQKQISAVEPDCSNLRMDNQKSKWQSH